MRDKRPVDELSIEELERVLAVRKREARMARLDRYQQTGRRVAGTPVESEVEESTEAPPEPEKSQPAPPPPAPEPVDFEGEPRFDDEPVGTRHDERSGVKWRDRVLMGVEIAAVLGIVYLLVNLFVTLQQVRDVTAGVQADAQRTAQAGLVTATATPIINLAAVLPDGHTVTLDANGKVIDQAFNLDEIPAQYRASYQLQLEATYIPPTSSPEGPTRIVIPKLNVDQQVVSGDGWEALKLGVGHHPGSANPGQPGNMVLSAHDDVYGEIFRYLDRLESGDEVTVYTLTQHYTYVVQSRQIVPPTATEILGSQGSVKQLTLISCYPYQKDTQRIAVFAILKES
ncbi:MAG TPA: class D sortase [Aggregatilineales bacterium]|nr:class D sortase [Aggregatilineales bacterium]